jgi:magnesium chelatase subunit H
VGLLLMRSYLLAGNAAHYDGVIAALEARGLRVIPGVRHRPGQRARRSSSSSPARRPRPSTRWCR